MARGSKKSNIIPHLMLLEVVIIILLIVAAGRLSIGGGIKSKKYNNPSVAEDIEEGSIYDTKGRALSSSVPSYSLLLDTSALTEKNAEASLAVLESVFDREAEKLLDASVESKTNTQGTRNIIAYNTKNYILLSDKVSLDDVARLRDEIEQNRLADVLVLQKESHREYPFSHYAIGIVKETETLLKDLLKPTPELGEKITYGRDVYLTLDVDMIYTLEAALKMALSKKDAKAAYGIIVEAGSGKIRAAASLTGARTDSPAQTGKPQKNEEDPKDPMKGLLSPLVSSVAGNTTYIAERARGKAMDSQNISLSTKELGYTVDDSRIISLYSGAGTGIAFSVPSMESPRYYILLAMDGGDNSKEDYSDAVYSAAEDVQSGLYAQQKI